LSTPLASVILKWTKRRRAMFPRIEEVIGENVRARREAMQMSQTELGRELQGHLPKAWERQAVSSAEKGRRAFTAAELLALARVLDCGVVDLLEARSLVQIDVAGPAYSPDSLKGLVAPGASGSGTDVESRLFDAAVDLQTAIRSLESSYATLIARVRGEIGADPTTLRMKIAAAKAEEEARLDRDLTPPPGRRTRSETAVPPSPEERWRRATPRLVASTDALSDSDLAYPRHDQPQPKETPNE
jgi:transcriptional regulator with XRE-family HTH domain